MPCMFFKFSSKVLTSITAFFLFFSFLFLSYYYQNYAVLVLFKTKHKKPYTSLSHSPALPIPHFPSILFLFRLSSSLLSCPIPSLLLHSSLTNSFSHHLHLLDEKPLKIKEVLPLFLLGFCLLGLYFRFVLCFFSHHLHLLNEKPFEIKRCAATLFAWI